MEKPSGTKTNHILSYSKLSPAQFERLCLWLIEREGYLRPEHLGDAGSEQERDVIAYRATDSSGQLWYFHCKHCRTISAATLIKEVEKYNDQVIADPTKKPFGIVFVTNARIDAATCEKVQKFCGTHGYVCDFWARNELDLFVKKHKDIVKEFPSLKPVAADKGLLSRIKGSRNVLFSRDATGVNVYTGDTYISAPPTPLPLPPDKTSNSRIITFIRKRAAALTVLMVLSLLAGGLILTIIRNDQKQGVLHSAFRQSVILQCPPLTVAIANFTEPSPSQKDLAQQVGSNFWAELNRKYQADIKIIKTEEKIDAFAIRSSDVVKQMRQSAHLVVYAGLLGSAPLKIQGSVCRVNLCDNQSDAPVKASQVQTVEPQTWSFECLAQEAEGDQPVYEVSENLVDVAGFVFGLALYEQHEFEQALNVLKDSGDPSARLIEGLISYERARQNESTVDLNSTITMFRKITDGRSDPGPNREIKAYANANAGNAFLLLSRLDSTHADTHLRDATNSYTEALNYYEETLRSPKKQREKSIRQAWGTTKSNLAVAMIWQARRQGLARMRPMFEQAERALEDVRRHCPINEYPSEWLGATLNLAALWTFEQSRMEQNPKEKLLRAADEFNKALGLLDKDRSFMGKYRWAQIQANLGTVYSNEALKSEMKLGKAADCYQKASTVFTDEKSLDWAYNEDDWGVVFVKQARLPENREQAVALLDQAIKKFENALTVYQDKNSLCDLRLATCYLADAQQEKGKRNDDKALLSTAKQNAEAAANMLERARASCTALELAWTQQTLGDVYFEMGQLDKARENYAATLGVWRSYKYSYNEHEAVERLRKVRNAH